MLWMNLVPAFSDKSQRQEPLYRRVGTLGERFERCLGTSWSYFGPFCSICISSLFEPAPGTVSEAVGCSSQSSHWRSNAGVVGSGRIDVRQLDRIAATARCSLLIGSIFCILQTPILRMHCCFNRRETQLPFVRGVARVRLARR